MTELLSRPTIDDSEEQGGNFDPSWQRPDGTPLVHRPGVDYSPEESSDAEVATAETEPVSEQNQDSLITAKSRVGRFLQRTADRLENGADRADSASERFSDMKEKAATRLRGIGSSALSRLKGAGLISLGLGIMSAEATGRGIKKTGEAAKTGTVKFGEKVGDGFITGMKKVESGMDTAGTKVVSAKETVSDYRAAHKVAAERKAETAATEKYERHAEKMKAKREKIAAKQERARKAKDAALARKAERRTKWANRRDALKQYGGYVKEGVVEAKDAGVKGAKFARDTVKVNAEFAGAAVRETSREQKAKLGRLATKARTAGQGAVEGWKSV